MLTRSRRDERGSGLLSAGLGLVFFVGFLMLALHIMVGLYRTSMVAATARDAAHAAADAPGAGLRVCTGALLAEAEAEAVKRLGPEAVAEAACTASSLQVTVSVPRPRLLPAVGSARIERSATVRLETRVAT